MTAPLFLLLLLYSSFTVGFAAVEHSGNADVAGEKNPFTSKAFVKRYWDQKITNSVPKPAFLLSKASPLSAVETATFAKLAANNALSMRLHEFCSSAHLLCSIQSAARSSGQKNHNSNFVGYQDLKNFTNYGSGQVNGGETFKNYSTNQDANIQNDFRRYSRGSSFRKSNFSSYASSSNNVDEEFHTYGTEAISGAGDFKKYTAGANAINLKFISY